MPAVERSEPLTRSVQAEQVQVEQVQAARVQRFEGQTPELRPVSLTPRASLRASDTPLVADSPLRPLP